MGGIWIEQRRVIAWRQGKNTLHLEWRCLHRRGIRKKGGSCFVISSDTDDGRQLAAMLTRHHPVPGTGNFWFFNLLSRTLIGYWLSYRGGSLQSFNLGWCTINLYVDPRLTYQLCLCSLCSAIHPMIGKHRLFQVWGLYFSHTSYLSALLPSQPIKLLPSLTIGLSDTLPKFWSGLTLMRCISSYEADHCALKVRQSLLRGCQLRY